MKTRINESAKYQTTNNERSKTMKHYITRILNLLIVTCVISAVCPIADACAFFRTYVNPFNLQEIAFAYGEQTPGGRKMTVMFPTNTLSGFPDLLGFCSVTWQYQSICNPPCIFTEFAYRGRGNDWGQWNNNPWTGESWNLQDNDYLLDVNFERWPYVDGRKIGVLHLDMHYLSSDTQQWENRHLYFVQAYDDGIFDRWPICTTCPH